MRVRVGNADCLPSTGASGYRRSACPDYAGRGGGRCRRWTFHGRTRSAPSPSRTAAARPRHSRPTTWRGDGPQLVVDDNRLVEVGDLPVAGNHHAVKLAGPLGVGTEMNSSICVSAIVPEKLSAPAGSVTSGVYFAWSFPTFSTIVSMAGNTFAFSAIDMVAVFTRLPGSTPRPRRGR